LDEGLTKVGEIVPLDTEVAEKGEAALQDRGNSSSEF
jgi:hypothetical protein